MPATETPELIAALCSLLMLCMHMGEESSIRDGALPGVNVEGGQDIQDTQAAWTQRQQRGWERWSGPVNTVSRSMTGSHWRSLWKSIATVKLED